MSKAISEIQAVILNNTNSIKVGGLNHKGDIKILFAEGVVLTIDQDGTIIKSGISKANIPYNVEEAAQRLRLHPQYVRDLCRYGVLEAVKSGRKWLIPHGNLKAYTNKHNA